MDYKSTRNGLLNTEKAIYIGAGPFDIPEILPLDADPEDIAGREAVGFNYIWSEKNPSEKVLHFFVDDYQFERVWREPNKYIERLRQFKYVVAPDFSLYTDHPKAVQIFNHYRKHWCARYWQEHGIKVIPCICWSTPDSFEWCFDGEPQNSIVCVSTIGGFGNHGCDRAAWKAGYDEMNCVLNPSHVILFGKEYAETATGRPTSTLRNEQLTRKSILSERPTGGVQILEYQELEELEDGKS